MKNHSSSRQYPRKDTHGKRDGVDEPVDEGMEPDSKHRNEAYRVMGVHSLIAYKRIDEPVKQVQTQVPREQVEGGVCIHGKCLRNEVKE